MSLNEKECSPNPDVNEYLEFICARRNDYYRLAFSFMRNEADALDAVSQMTVKVLEKHHTLRNSESFPPWSKQILANICRNKLKERKRLLPAEDFPAPPPGESGIEERLLIRAAVAALPLKYREAVILRYYLGYEYKNIARLLKIPEGTVKSRLNRGLSDLRNRLKGDFSHV
jgi:RNA polymerase sigma-70 factor (ECF subfamily)